MSDRRRQRLLVAVLLGCVVAVATAIAVSAGASDFRFWHTGARLLLDGTNPYPLRPGNPAWPMPDPLFYPLPALLVTAPLVWMPVHIAAGLVLGLSSGALAWFLTETGWHKLWFFASPGFLMAVEIGQWTPTLCLAAFVPWLGALLAVKPNLGLPLFVWRPSRTAVVGGTVLVLLSFLVMPRWPLAWLTNVRLLDSHPAPLFTWRGAWLWLALLRWRSADARFLLVSAAVPQLLFFSDQLPLALLARTRREAGMVAFVGLLAWLAWYAGLSGADRYVAKAAPYVLAGVYLPALIMVLRRSDSRDAAPASPAV